MEPFAASWRDANAVMGEVLWFGDDKRAPVGRTRATVQPGVAQFERCLRTILVGMVCRATRWDGCSSARLRGR